MLILNQRLVGLTDEHGEEASADNIGAENWVKNVLPEYLEKYQPNCVYNADESALFFKTLSSGTLAYRHEVLVGKKLCKDRITLLFVTNSTGSDKHIYSIGKSKKPRCFKNATVPITYFSNKNAWMTQSLWCEIMKDINKKMKAQGKKIILIVDNATCHKVVDTFDNVITIFLPPNVTSLIQPLDQGIIRSFKAKYRQNLIRKHLLHIESGGTADEFLKQISILEALRISARAWREVTPDTIKNCFKKAGWVRRENEEDEIMMVEPIPDEVEVDDEVPCWGTTSDEEIVKALNDDVYCESEDDDCEEMIIKPKLAEVLKALKTLKDYFYKNDSALGQIDDLHENIAVVN